MTITPPSLDEITLTVPDGRHLCQDRQHRNLGRLAGVIVTFGQLGIPGTPRDAFWPGCCQAAPMAGSAGRWKPN